MEMMLKVFFNMFRFGITRAFFRLNYPFGFFT